MGKLTEIINTDALKKAWDTTEAAGEREVLPAGKYTCRLVKGELFNSRSGTPGFKITLRVLDGECAGRYVWHELFLTPAAMPYSKRDLAKIGITGIDQLEKPVPPGLRVDVHIVQRMNNDSTPYNRVNRFEVVGLDGIEDADFAPGGGL